MNLGAMIRETEGLEKSTSGFTKPRPKIFPVGLGLWRTDNRQAAQAVTEALKAGYRAVDTAAVYNNEQGVGWAVRQAIDEGLSREEISVTTKLWNDSHGFAAALRAFDQSLARLGLDWVDTYLIQWPAPGQNQYVEAWKALKLLKDEGRVKVIGVSNFMPEHVDRLYEETGQRPEINQLEIHPRFQQREVCAAMAARGVPVEAWAPLGSGQSLNDPLFRKLAMKYRRTPAQIILRWHLECGRGAVPKSSRPGRIRENFNIFDFRLDPEDMRQIALLDSGQRLGPDPRTFR